MDRLAVQQDLTGIERLHPGHDLDERRFSGPIFTEQGMHLARPELQRYPRQRLGRAEPFRDGAHLEHGSGGAPVCFGCGLRFQIDHDLILPLLLPRSPRLGTIGAGT